MVNKSFLLLSVLLIASFASAMDWQVVKVTGDGEKYPEIPASFGTTYYDYAMITLMPGFTYVALFPGKSTSEAILETEAFIHDSNEPIKFQANIPIASGLQVYLGVDNKFWKQLNSPTWWNGNNEDCIKDLKVTPNSDPSSTGDPIFSEYEYSGAQWGDNKPHKLTLRVVKGDEEPCANYVSLKEFEIVARGKSTVTDEELPTTTPEFETPVDKFEGDDELDDAVQKVLDKIQSVFGGGCEFDSDCPAICDGATLWQSGCNLQTYQCEKTFSKDCSQENEEFQGTTFKKTCSQAECVIDREELIKKRAELRQEFQELSEAMHEVKEKARKLDDYYLETMAELTTQFLSDAYRYMTLQPSTLQIIAIPVRVAYNEGMKKLTRGPMSKGEFAALAYELKEHFYAEVDRLNDEMQDKIDVIAAYDEKIGDETILGSPSTSTPKSFVGKVRQTLVNILQGKLFEIKLPK